MLIVQASRCILDILLKLIAQQRNEDLKRVMFPSIGRFHNCALYKASIEAQTVRES